MTGLRTRPLALLLALAGGLLAGPAAGAELRCDIATKFTCNADGCAPSATTVWNLIDLEDRLYRRCDVRGCDSYPAEVSHAGLFTVFNLPELGALAKLNVATGAFTEVATFLNSVLVSFGHCGA